MSLSSASATEVYDIDTVQFVHSMFRKRGYSCVGNYQDDGGALQIGPTQVRSINAAAPDHDRRHSFCNDKLNMSYLPETQTRLRTSLARPDESTRRIPQILVAEANSGIGADSYDAIVHFTLGSRSPAVYSFVQLDFESLPKGPLLPSLLRQQYLLARVAIRVNSEALRRRTQQRHDVWVVPKREGTPEIQATGLAATSTGITVAGLSRSGKWEMRPEGRARWRWHEVNSGARDVRGVSLRPTTIKKLVSFASSETGDWGVVSWE
ncbi:hypothetical protein WOLCODRAFT_161625 [Wolfiporia cocos MD-104 SS10]|uniref:Uncharacterized protein n=1 Tax=Wolfiporia cocos (strain MD-104) TaxID=742152 RepID=A0A2H3JIB9_WOLCO|nr:hypothetical protein WOLCODRAFT_161625 [Wolfiporia cocos MD-104 SS10]